MTAIKAIYDGANFKTLQPIPVDENYEVIITFINPIETKISDDELLKISNRLIQQNKEAYEVLAQ